MYSDDPTGPYGRRYRTPVTAFGLTPIPRGGVRKAVHRAVLDMAREYPREAAPVQMVTLAGIRATQPSVINRALRSHLARPAKPGYHGDSEPLLLIAGGVRYLWDGHHRTCLALARGVRQMPMRVMDVDDPHVHRALTEFVTERRKTYDALHAEIDRIKAEFGPIFPVGSGHPEGERQYRVAFAASQEARAALAEQMRVRLAQPLAA